MKAATTSLSFKPESLPPTEREIFFLALRVHLQVAQLKLLDVNCLNSFKYLSGGWGTSCFMEILTNFYVGTSLDSTETPKYILRYAVISTLLLDYRSLLR